MNSIVSALRFLFIHSLDCPDLARRLVRLAHRGNLPLVLSRDEVARLINATTRLKRQAAVSVAYGAGLRVAEMSMLKVADVDSERVLLHVGRGEGGRYRNAKLSENQPALLREKLSSGRSLANEAAVVGTREGLNCQVTRRRRCSGVSRPMLARRKHENRELDMGTGPTAAGHPHPLATSHRPRPGQICESACNLGSDAFLVVIDLMQHR
jgi:integrase